MQQSQTRPRQSFGRREEGIALLVTLMVLMLVSVLMVGFVASIIADTRASGLDRDQTQAYAAAHAGLEQITSDLSTLFVTDFSPSGAQVAALRATPPTLTGFSFIAPGGAAGSGYWVVPRVVDGSGNPLPEDPINGSMITAGPYQGFRGIITPYDITVTARSTGGAEVRMRRTLQTVAIPVFQFGMFSETDLAFHAGEAFGFGGRVHTNGNLFLASADGAALTIADRITAVKEIIRTHLPNGLATTTGYEGTVRIPTTVASNPVNNVYRNLARNEGSINGTIPPTQTPQAAKNNAWVGLSQNNYVLNIRNGDTGAKKLDLPLVADLNSDGVPDAQPIELIRRPPAAESTTGVIYQQRYFAQASLRILLSDTQAQITSLPTVTSALPVSLSTGNYNGLVGALSIHAPLAASGGASGAASYGSGSSALPASVYKSNLDEPLLGGFIKIEMQRAGTTPTNGVWEDVTDDILKLGITGRNLADSNQALASRWNKVPDGASDTCAEPNPNAVIRLQRVRDIPVNVLNQPCGMTVGLAISQTKYDFWPLALYDTREGETRDGVDANTMGLSGVMHYVELDIANLKKWLAGTTGTKGTFAKNDNGFIVYFSDRRNNSNGTGETGEYGNEDVVNLTNTAGTPNNALDVGEDFNGNGALDFYGKTPRNVPAGASGPFSGATPTTQITGANSALIARANRTVFFRRALKLVNGEIVGTTSNLPTAGLTIAAENPVYVEGNYNATAASVTATGNVPAAVIADAVTLLSNNWSDLRSFTDPTDSLERPASTTGYRMAIITGKTLAFPQPAGTSSSFGSDGGAHNFVRSLEQWDNGSIHRYRGSLVSFFISRQAVGSFKCCEQDAYNRGDRDWSFDTDFLLPSRLPPGTPMFRDVNTLTFRQLLRPTQ